MEDIEVDVDTNKDVSFMKRSGRAKKQKKFFDDGVSTPTSAGTTFRVKLKTPVKPKVAIKKNVVEANASKPKENVKDAAGKEKVESQDDEEAWLDALEKGELDDNGDIPKTRDPAMMTARQRALLDRNYSSNLVEELPPPKEEMTEEEKRKRLEKNRKRKLQAAKKAEETQKQTIKKLVEIPSKGEKARYKSSNNTNSQNKQTSKMPMIKYINRSNSSTLSFPEGHDYPLKPQSLKPPPTARACFLCGKKRNYCCSKTGVALCSLTCYKENLKQFKLEPCS